MLLAACSGHGRLYVSSLSMHVHTLMRGGKRIALGIILKVLFGDRFLTSQVGRLPSTLRNMPASVSLALGLQGNSTVPSF